MFQTEMLFGPCDGRTFRLRPGQTTVSAFDGRFAYFYELNDEGLLVYSASYPAEVFPFDEFEREFRHYAHALEKASVSSLRRQNG
jgi:hypothetical protein